MDELTAEQLADRLVEVGVLHRELAEHFLEQAGGPGKAGLDDFILVLIRGGYWSEEQRSFVTTNWQLTRALEGHRSGYFYGEWKVLYLIGGGRTSRYYRATHVETGDVKALKVLRARYVDDRNSREIFIQRARKAMHLRHPNIVRIHEVDEQNGRVFAVTDFVEGQSLRDFLPTRQTLSVMQSLSVVVDVVSALAYASHSHGISHGDINPSNILLSRSGKAILTNFGLFIDINIDTKNNAVDSDPQRPGGDDYWHKDIYQLGCMLYLMLTGENPLHPDWDKDKLLSTKRLREVLSAEQRDPELTNEVVNLTHRLMDTDPVRRFQSVEDANLEIQAIYQSVKASKVHLASVSHDNPASSPNGKTILIVESNEKIQDSLRRKLKNVGFRVLIVSRPERVMNHWFDSNGKVADCVIFGCRGLGARAVDAFETFAVGESTAGIPAILLVTEALRATINPKLFVDHRVLFILPFKFGRLELALKEIL